MNKCEYCSPAGKYIGVTDYDNAETRLFIRVAGESIQIYDENYPGMTDSHKIRFCPMCGRELTRIPHYMQAERVHTLLNEAKEIIKDELRCDDANNQCDYASMHVGERMKYEETLDLVKRAEKRFET